jgi:hypothetical protein
VEVFTWSKFTFPFQSTFETKSRTQTQRLVSKCQVVEHFDISLLLVVSQKVMLDVYVLSAAVFNRIIRHADCTLIVT